MPAKNTKVLAVRVKDETVARIEARIKSNGTSLNKWLNWAISLGLRKHDKKGEQMLLSKDWKIEADSTNRDWR